MHLAVPLGDDLDLCASGWCGGDGEWGAESGGVAGGAGACVQSVCLTVPAVGATLQPPPCPVMKSLVVTGLEAVLAGQLLAL